MWQYRKRRYPCATRSSIADAVEAIDPRHDPHGIRGAKASWSFPRKSDSRPREPMVSFSMGTMFRRCWQSCAQPGGHPVEIEPGRAGAATPRIRNIRLMLDNATVRADPGERVEFLAHGTGVCREVRRGLHLEPISRHPPSGQSIRHSPVIATLQLDDGMQLSWPTRLAIRHSRIRREEGAKMTRQMMKDEFRADHAADEQAGHRQRPLMGRTIACTANLAALIRAATVGSRNR